MSGKNLPCQLYVTTDSFHLLNFLPQKHFLFGILQKVLKMPRRFLLVAYNTQQ